MAHAKTQNLLRLSLPVTALVKNEANPNKMAAREFDLLIDNIERTGLTDPILVRPLDYEEVFEIAAKFDMPDLGLVLTKEELKFRIVGGHHRFDAAAYLGFEDVPVTVIMDDSFDEDEERFQLVRMNMIRGKLDPQAFFDSYNSLAPAYSDEVLQDAFGFADEAEFRKLIDQTAKALPDKNLQKKFKEAAEEIKTIDGLSKLLNEMFTKYGDTLPFGYMVFDHGGQRSMWLRIEGKTMNAIDLIGTLCIDQARTVDDVIGGILQLAAKGELKDAQAIKDGKVRILFWAGYPIPEVKEFPHVTSFVTKPDDQKLLDFMYAGQTYARPFIAPPELPGAIHAVLKDAFAATVRDPQLLADAARQNLEVRPVSADETADMVRKAYATPQALVDRMSALLKAGK